MTVPGPGPGTDWSGRRVGVTGIAGFVGGRLGQRLAAAGAAVAGTLRPGGRAPDGALAAAGVACEAVDLERPAAVAAWLASAAPRVVFHAAGVASVGAAAADPAAALEANAASTWRLLAAASRLAEPPAVVVLSSAAADGGDGGGPVSAYHLSKRCAELAADCWRGTPLRVGVARLPNLFGAGDHHGGRIVPSVVAALAAGGPLELRSRPDEGRVFLHVDDAVEGLLAHAAALVAGRDLPPRLTFDGGRRLTLAAVAAVAAELAGRPLEVRSTAPAGDGGDPPTGGREGGEGTVDPGDGSEPASRWLDWRPRRSFRDGMAEVLAGAGLAAGAAAGEGR